MSQPSILPITRAQVSDIAKLLHSAHFHSLSVERIEQIILHDWPTARPNYGYFLESQGRAVGCILGAYSEREIRGHKERFCNIGTWYVEPEFRSHSIPLAWALGDQPGFTFTALTPNLTGQMLFRKRRYELLASECHLFPPGLGIAATRSIRASFSSDIDTIERELDPVDRRILRDHRSLNCRHFLLTPRGEGRYAYVVTRRWKCWRHGIIPVSEILYISDKSIGLRYLEALKLRILAADRSMALGLESRLLGDAAPRGIVVPRGPSFFKSLTVGAEDVDCLYSEMVLR